MNSIPSQPLEPESRPLAESDSLIEILSDLHGETVPDSQQLRGWTMAALEDHRASVVIKIVSDEEMAALNLQFAGKNKSTNVLSFPAEPLDQELISALQSSDCGNLDESVAVTQALGDIAICAEVVNRETQEQNKSPDAHWAHMVVHGVLHLRGFDHISERDAIDMESREVMILNALGFPNPYLTSLNSGDEVSAHT